MERVIWSKEWHTDEERVIFKINENIILSGTRSAQFQKKEKTDDDNCYCDVREGPNRWDLFHISTWKETQIELSEERREANSTTTKKSMCLPGHWGTIVRLVVRDLCV